MFKLNKNKYRYKQKSLRQKMVYKFGRLPDSLVFLRLFTLSFVLSLVGGVFMFLPSGADATATHPVLTQEGYIFANDDGDLSGFPYVEARVNSAEASDVTSHTVSLPSGIQPGDLLVGMFSGGLAGAATWPAGWVELTGLSGSSQMTSWAYREASGTEGSSISITTGQSMKSAHNVLKISGAEDPGSQAPEIATADAATNGNPPSLSPSGGAKNYLWIAWATSESGSRTIDAPPTNYSNFNLGTNGAVSDSAEAASGERKHNASSEDPGEFTYSSSESSVDAALMAIHPSSDIASMTQMAGSEFNTGKTLDAVRQGERINLRTHITNTGTAISSTDELGLFYDKGDGIWTKARVQNPVAEAPGASEDCQGFIEAGGSSDWYCDIITDGDHSNDATNRVSMAINPVTNQPWVVTRNSEGGGNLVLSKYVGSGGNCDGFDDIGGSDAWSCETIFDGTDSGDVSHSALAFDSDGNPYIAFRDRPGTHDNLVVAEYVGSGGNCDGFDDTGGSDAWQCTTVLDGNHVADDVAYFQLAVSPSGAPWIITANDNSFDRNLLVAQYVGGGSGNCQNFSDLGASGSNDWQCTHVVDSDSGDDVEYASISFDADSNPWISYRNVESGGDDLTVVNYVGGGGGNCQGFDEAGGSNNWQCTTVVEGGESNDFVDNTIRFNPDGNPVVVSRNVEATGTAGGDLIMVEYVGSGGNCQGFDAPGGSNAWQCTTIVDGDSFNDVWRSDFVFDASGNPLITYRNDESGLELVFVNYVGSGGNCDGFDDTGGSDAWQCTTVADGGSIDNPAISLDNNGDIWMASRSVSNSQGDLTVARLDTGGEIQIAPSIANTSGDSLSESHADMTSATDTTNRDDADCLDGTATWNNGVYFGSELGTGLSLADGNTTSQCTEIVWTLDTSQAVAGTTYRFVVATNDAFTADNGPWRGMASVATDGYPELTIRNSDKDAYRYSKDVLAELTDCDASGWGCLTIDGTGNVGEDSTVAFDNSGTPWISYQDDTNTSLKIARYVGSGGSGCADSAWSCETVDSSGTTGIYANMTIDISGNPWIAYRTAVSNELNIARYVGSGGTGCDISSWTCETVDDTGASGSGAYPSIAFDDGGTPWISYRVGDVTSNDLRVARYVGSGGSGCGTITAWTCTDIDTTNNVGVDTSLAFDHYGNAWIAYRDTNNTTLRIARYIGSGGSGCASSAWTCTVVDTSSGDVTERSTSLAFSPDGEAWISYYLESSTDLKAAQYVGGGSGSGCTSSDWTCTNVDTSGDNGSWSSIAFGPSGNAWISYYHATSGDLRVANYVGSGGSGCANGSWNCTSVNTMDDVGTRNSIAFDRSGTPWLSYYDTTNTALRVAKLHVPSGPLGANVVTPYNSKNAGSGDLRYHLTSGLAPATDQYGVCGGNSGLAGYCGLYHPEGHTDSLSVNANERPIYGFSTRYDTNASLPTANVYFQTDMSPATENVVLQVYRYGSTNAWETVSTYSDAGCASDNCLIRGLPSGTASEYFESDGSDYWVHFRVYQTEATSGYTFSIDSFDADTNPVHLRGGRVFREQLSDPLGW